MKDSSVISILLAAGASTRMKSKTSKLLHLVLGRPLIDWALDQARWISNHAVVVVGHQREEIENRIEKNSQNLKIQFAHQKEQKGTADAVRVAVEALQDLSEDRALFIMGADAVLLTSESLKAFQKDFEQKRAVLSVMSTVVKDPAAYGRILRDTQGRIEKIVEAKDCSSDQLAINEINTGFYLVRWGVLKESLKSVGNANKGREFYLTDLVEICRQKGHLVSTFEISEEEAHGVNTREDLARVDTILSTRINRQWMMRGVTFQNPGTIRVEADVVIEPDVELEMGVILKGSTKIGEGTLVGAYTVIEDSSIASHVEIEAHSHIKGAQIAEGSSVGPFARLRPGSILEEDVHIGNFVEVKKSHLHSGVKAGHLSYLGDAEIGKNSNIGAGTITCNYDGFSKYKTELGENVFIGSNSSLVAPVKIGSGAMIGAGSVISKDVKPDAISLERSEQVEIRDGARRFRSRHKKDK